MKTLLNFRLITTSTVSAVLYNLNKIAFSCLITFILLFQLPSIHSQICFEEGFENCIDYGEASFYDLWVPGWINTHGTSCNDVPEFYSGIHSAHAFSMYNPNCVGNERRGEGFALNYTFIAGRQYQITYFIKHEQTTESNLTAQCIILRDPLPNKGRIGPWCDPLYDILPIPQPSFLTTANTILNTWVENTFTFTPLENYSQLWFRCVTDPPNPNPHPNNLYTNHIYIDDVKIECEEPICNCPTGYTVGIDKNSVTNIENSSIPAFSWGRSTPICINGRLNITSQRPFQLLMDNIIYMGEGASIHIMNGSLLWTASSDYVPCEGKMYKGIVVEGGTIAAYGNKIYDAHHGIEFTESSSVIAINGNTFDRNYVGIEIGGPVLGITRIIGNHFVSNGNYIAAYDMQPVKLGTDNRTWAGVNMFLSTWEVSGNNEFFGIGAGVRANRSILFMNGNHAKELITDGTNFDNGSLLIAVKCPKVIANNNIVEDSHSGMAIDNSNFAADGNTIEVNSNGIEAINMENKKFKVSNSVNLDFGIYGILVRSDNLKELLIHGNSINVSADIAISGIGIVGTGGTNSGIARIYDNQNFEVPKSCKGILVYGYEKVDIYNNVINIRNTSTPSGSEGIILGNAGISYLYNNTINGGNAPSTKGIVSTLSAYTTYCCNHVTNNIIGFEFQGNCEQSHLRHNIISDNTTGLLCKKETWIGPQKLGYSNTWPGSAGNFEALHSGRPIDMQNSRFDVTNGPSDFFPFPTPPAIWFVTRVGIDKSCIADVACGEPGEPEDKKFRYYNDEDVLISFTDEFTANPGSDWGDFADGQSWNSKIQLLEKLDLFPELLGQSTLKDAFNNSNLAGSLRDYLDARVAIRNSGIISGTANNSLNAIHSNIETSLNEIELIDILLAQNGADTPSLINLRNIELNNLTTFREQYEVLLIDLETSRVNLLVSILPQVQQLNASNVIQNEEKAIDLHLIQYLIQGKDYLSSNVLDNIFVIADQCIHQNSYSVSFARMLYLRAVDYDFNDDNLCPPSQPLVTSSENNEIEDGIRVYPNPTKSWVIIESLNKDVTILKIEVLDIHGRLLHYESNGKALGKINLSTTNLKSGIYILKIEFLNGEVILKKLLIE